MGETLLQTFFAAFGLPTVCLRYFNMFGARQNPNGDYAAVIPRFVGRMKMGQPPVVYGDGEQTRDFVYVADVVRANLAACEGPRAVGQVINVASGQRVSLLELVATLNAVLGTQLAPEFKPERKGDIRHSAGDGGQMAELLGMKRERNLDSQGRIRWILTNNIGTKTGVGLLRTLERFAGEEVAKLAKA